MKVALRKQRKQLKSKQLVMNRHDLGPTVTGLILSLSVGSFVFQALGAFVIGILGALGGWVFGHYIKPLLERLIKKYATRRTKKP